MSKMHMLRSKTREKTVNILKQIMFFVVGDDEVR